MGPIKVRVVEAWQRDAFDVYVFPKAREAEAYPGQLYAPDHEGELQLIEYEPAPGSRPFEQIRIRPTITLPSDVMRAVVEQTLKLRPDLDAQDAIRDARTTRDRLLALVEQAALDNLDVVGLVEKAAAK